MKTNRIISVVGLGYVGLPVAMAFADKHETIGFDISERRVGELLKGIDRNGTFEADELRKPNLVLTAEPTQLRAATFHIIAVPTPVDDARKPDLTPLVSASEIVGQVLKKGDIVVYESTVFPGATEEVCIPILEAKSGLKFGSDFGVGYSPERINPGDKEHGFAQIKKVVSGNDESVLAEVANLYGSVVTAGIFKAQSIKVAEAAKVIENTQRDLNIALMNELAIVFDRLGINTRSVLEAAGTKWNFLPFTPGLVGGHCIGVDPYYLTYKAEQVGYHPEVILAGRRINDGMGRFIAGRLVKEMIHAGQSVLGKRVTVLGFTFKENVPDIRNTRVIDIIQELKEFGLNVQVCDPLAHPDEAQKYYGLALHPLSDLPPADAVVLAVAHREFKSLTPADIRRMLVPSGGVLVDVKAAFKAQDFSADGIRYWQL